MKFDREAFAALAALQFALILPQVAIAETILKRETVSLKGCLKVIEMTANQTGLVPQMTLDTETQKVAEFVAPDGTVVIKCDGDAKEVVVSLK